MKKALLLPTIAAAILNLQAQQQDQETLLVRYRQGTPESNLRSSIEKHGGREHFRVRETDLSVVKVSKKRRDELLRDLSNDPSVLYVEPDHTARINLTPNDPYYSSYQWHHAKVGTPGAWDLTTGSSNVIIAVIDSGIDSANPEFTGRILSRGYDFANFDNNPADDNGHGTMVTGTAAASGNNGLGVAGVDWKASILPVKVTDAAGNASYSSIISGINYAATNGARVINLSLGGTNSSKALQDAVNFAFSKGAVVVAAAGNNGTTNPVYPAACGNCLAVSAIDSNDMIAAWSSRGSFVDLCAPGVGITTTGTNGAYMTASGTSFASPIVSGVAGLIISANPLLSNSTVVSLLTGTARDLGAAGQDILYGAGRIDASNAVASARNIPVPVPDTVPPSTSVASPVDGSSIAGLRSVNVRVASVDNVAVTRAELYIDNRLVYGGTYASFSYNWSTSKVASGKHTIQSKAYDAAGNSSSSALVTVTK